MPSKLGEGGRLITCHAGTSKEFIHNCLLLFASKYKGDYHEEMDSVRFKKWFEESVLPNIPENLVIAMDNAPFSNSRQTYNGIP